MRARDARERRDDGAYDGAIRRLENLPPHAIRPPEAVRREFGLQIREETCTPSAPSPRCRFHAAA